MDIIEVNFLGNVDISFNGQSVVFPFAKAEAMFIYLLVNRQATRSSIASLLWSEKTEEFAKRNLRNAVYAVKKATSCKIFSEASNKIMLMFNPDLKIVSDVDDFLNNQGAPYGGTFLKGIGVKDADNFENWVMRTREKLENVYTERTYKAIESEKDNRNYRKVEEYANSLIQIDEYNEEAYRTLMQSYSEQGKYVSSLDVYNKLTSKLYTELSIVPDEKTEALYEQIQKKVNQRAVPDRLGSFFYGRRTELSLLKAQYSNLIDGKCKQSCILIQGEMGIGKTFLKDKFMEMVDSNTVLTVQVNCYEFEKENTYKPWRKIVDKIWSEVKDDALLLQSFSGFDFENGENPIDRFSMKINSGFISEWLCSFLSACVTYKRLIIGFEDIQWMDEKSISLLKSLMFELKGKPVLFLATCRNDYNDSIERFVSLAKQQDKLLDIKLKRFSYNEAYDFLNKSLPGYSLGKKTVDKIYFNTEGNTFFLTEYLSLVKSNQSLNNMTYKMKEVLKRRFEEISPRAKIIVEIVSVFDDFAPMYLLEQVSHKDELELLDIMDELCNKHILAEVDEENISFKFTHRKLSEYIYGNLSESRKKALHNTIGRIIENNIPYDYVNVNACYKLIYHYGKSCNHLDLLRIKIKLLNVFFDYSHELFPVLYYNSEFYEKVYIDDGKTIKSLNEIEILLQKVSGEITDRDKFQTVYMEYLHMMGRYLIKKGNYGAGLSYIDEMLEKSQTMGMTDYRVEGLKQKIYYCIQTNDVENMKELVDEALSLLSKTDDKSKLAIFLRFKAICCKMAGQYSKAEEICNRSIQILSRNSRDANKYALSIAAAYGYIGDIRKLVSGFADALSYYKKAIQICEDKKVHTSLAYFEVKAGECAYYIRNIRAAKQYFLAALKIYRHYKYIWGKPIAECFMCLINIKEKNLDEAVEYLVNAEQDSKYLKNPKELGVLYKTKVEIRSQFEDDCILKNSFQEYLAEDVGYYVEEARKYFSLSKDILEESSKSSVAEPVPVRPGGKVI